MTPLYLLFACDEAELRAQLEKVDFTEHGITLADASSVGNSTGTLIYRGAAFDFVIAHMINPAAEHYIFCDSDLAAVRSSLGLSLGAAVASGQHVPAVVKAILMLGEILGSALNAKATYWSPASVVAGFGYFSESVVQYDNGAAFPSLVTIGFDTTADDSIRTTGLSWLSGQELLFERDGLPVNDAMRYVVRLVHDIATNGAVDRVMDVPGMVNSEQLTLTPDVAESALIVRRVYIQNGVNTAG
jgi:hypothetical protein